MVEAQDDQAACHVEQRHDRDDLLGNGSDTADAAEEDERRDDRADDADNDLRCAERGLEATLIEFACTMLPVKPRAKMIATEKKPARNLPKPPWKRARM